MVNSNHGKAVKGSRACLQNHVENHRAVLINEILAASPSLLAFGAEDLKWKSPLPNVNPKLNYYEYRDDFLDAFKPEYDDTVLSCCKEKLKDFWPKRGPQWDGIALVEGSERGILLVEAKAHPAETKSDMKATDETSKMLIRASINHVKGYMNAQVQDSFWTGNNYQLANRIAFLYFLNEICSIPAWLALVNFIDDEYKPTELNSWVNHYRVIFRELGLKTDSRLIEKLVMVYPKA